MAALRDVPGDVERMLHITEQLHHFGARLHEKLGRRKPHPVRVRHGFARLDAEQDLVRTHVIVTQIVRVVGNDQRNPCLARKPWTCGISDLS